MASVLGYTGFWLKDSETGVDWKRVVHGEQRLTLDRPIPASASVVGRTRVKGIADKGADKGALLVVERIVSERDTGERLAVVEQVIVCRGDGGFSSNHACIGEFPPALPAPPQRSPDATWSMQTRPEMPLIYRLSGDFNPLHADTDVARAAGFDRPVLHGLATYGLAERAILDRYCGYDPSRLRSINTRFSSPVFAGENIVVEMWQTGNEIAFRARVPERDVVVLTHGVAEFVV